MSAKAPSNGRAVYRLVLRAEPHEVDVTARLKGLLKVALRRFGFRALRVEQVAEAKNDSRAI